MGDTTKMKALIVIGALVLILLCVLGIYWISENVYVKIRKEEENDYE